jgi:hypothetical protein
MKLLFVVILKFAKVPCGWPTLAHWPSLPGRTNRRVHSTNEFGKSSFVPFLTRFGRLCLRAEDGLVDVAREHRGHAQNGGIRGGHDGGRHGAQANERHHWGSQILQREGKRIHLRGGPQLLYPRTPNAKHPSFSSMATHKSYETVT